MLKQKRGFMRVDLTIKYDFRMLVAAESIIEGIKKSSDKVMFNKDTYNDLPKDLLVIKKLKNDIVKIKKANPKQMDIASDLYVRYGEFFLNTIKDLNEKKDASKVELYRDAFIANNILHSFFTIENGINKSEEVVELIEYSKNCSGAVETLLYKYFTQQKEILSSEEQEVMKEIDEILVTWPSEEEVTDEILEFITDYSEYILKTIPFEVDIVIKDVERQNKIATLNINKELKQKMLNMGTKQ